MYSDQIFDSEQAENNLFLTAELSTWKDQAIHQIASYPAASNFFIGECYFKAQHLEAEPLLAALMTREGNSEGIINRLVKRHLGDTYVSELFDANTAEIRFRFITHNYPLLFAERVLAPLCQHPETAVFTRFVNAKRMGFAEKRICLDHPEVRSTAYWGMRRKVDLPMQLWAYDLAKCNPELEEQTYSRKVFPILTADHMAEYQRTGKIYEDKDYQFFLDGKYSYIDLSRSWSTVKDLEVDWEELNAVAGSNEKSEESCS